MDIHTAAKYMKHGYRIRRPHWPDSLYRDENDVYSLAELLYDDWEIITQDIIKDFPLTYFE